MRGRGWPLRRLAEGLLVAMSAVAALAIGEAALRLGGFSYPQLYVTDEVTGSRLRAGAEGWSRGEGEVYVKISSQSLRDREHAVAKPPRTYRIAVLGDSYAEALQVPLEQTFWALLPRELERCRFAGDRKIEPLNFGVSGYGTAQELLTLRQRAWDFSPDLVLLAFFPGNDVRNNSKALEREKLRPFFVLRDGELELDDSFRRSPRFRERADTRLPALQDLRLYQLVRSVRAADPGPHRHNSPIAAALADGAEGAPMLMEPGLDENVLRPPAHPEWREAWAITDKLIAAVHAEVRARGTRFLLAVLSTPAIVYPDRGLRERYAEALGAGGLLYPEDRLAHLAQQQGFDLLALAPAMQRHADATGEFLHGLPNGKPGFGHWNAKGHALAASLIGRHLCGN